MSRNRHITLPAGFKAAGVSCGVKPSGAEDLAIIAAQADAAAAIVTTRNQVVGAPIIWCRRILPRGRGRLRGIVINSGNANVCTAQAGLKDAAAMAAETARRIGTAPEKILVASTGVIGVPLPMNKIRAGIAAGATSLGTREDRAALRAMMTTDKREKSAVARVRLAGRSATVAGIVKGSGMVAPSMATMLCVITTDAAVTPAALHKALRSAVGSTFNTITIDSDTSTSDMVTALASGRAANKPITARSADYGRFLACLRQLCGKLAHAVVADAEGATRIIRVTVRQARNPSDAEAAAKAVANSPLVKCAVHGADPNWGRIAAALGKSPAKVAPDRLSIKVGGRTLFSAGNRRNFDRRAVSAHLAGSTVEILCDLGLGKATYTALGCDLSKAYVDINAAYTT